MTAEVKKTKNFYVVDEAPPPHILDQQKKETIRQSIKNVLRTQAIRDRQSDPELLRQILAFIDVLVPINSLLAIYFSRHDELRIDTALKMRTFQFVYPRVEQDGGLAFYIPFDSHSFTPNEWGIMEPNPLAAKKISLQDIPFILVPGLAFDRQFNRLGRGQGYYDRALKDYHGVKIGVCLSDQILNEQLPNEAHDVKMDVIITERFLLKNTKKD